MSENWCGMSVEPRPASISRLVGSSEFHLRNEMTSVATNGAEALAGSKPMRRIRNGSIDPAIEPNVTTPSTADATVRPISSECGP